MYKAIVFDFDDTIVDSNRIKQETFTQILSSLGFNSKEVLDVIKNEYMSRVEVFKHFLPSYTQDQLSKVIALFSKKVYDKIICLKPSSDFFKIVKEAQEKNTLIFLSSNTPENQLIEIVTKMNLISIFKQVHGYPKKKEDTLKRIINQYGLSPKSILVIGDGLSDLEAAKKNGTDFFLVKELSLINAIPLTNE